MSRKVPGRGLEPRKEWETRRVPEPTAPTGPDVLDERGLTIASSARVLGTVDAGPRSYLAQGAWIRAAGGDVRIGHDSAVLETSVVVAMDEWPVTIGRKTVFGHRCTIVGAAIGDLCEIGNASIILPGASLGNGCFLG